MDTSKAAVEMAKKVVGSLFIDFLEYSFGFLLIYSFLTGEVFFPNPSIETRPT